MIAFLLQMKLDSKTVKQAVRAFCCIVRWMFPTKGLYAVQDGLFVGIKQSQRGCNDRKGGRFFSERVILEKDLQFLAQLLFRVRLWLC